MRGLMISALLAINLGCGTAPASSDTLARRDRSVLGLEEIQAAKGIGWSAYDLIAQLRPEYLRSRGPSSVRDSRPPTATVYLDGVRYGNLETLRTMNGDQIQRIEYISAADATTRYGTDHVGGALLIKTR